MSKHCRWAPCLALTLGMAAIAWHPAFALQSALSTLHLTAKDLDYAATFLTLPSLSNQSRAAAKAIPSEQRGAIVRELATALKTLAMSEAFQKAYAERIAREYQAADHGLKLDQPVPANPEEIEKQMDDVMRQVAVQMATALRALPAEGLQPMFESDVESWNEMAKDTDADPADRAKVRKLVDGAKAVAPLLKSDPEAFKKRYTLLKSIEMGGPETEAELMGSSNNLEQEQKLRREQEAWNRYNFKSVAKQRLTELLDVAVSVDFNAETRMQNGKMVFVNPAYEQKPYEWKLMYRIGRSGVTAASEVARAWLKEL